MANFGFNPETFHGPALYGKSTWPKPILADNQTGRPLYEIDTGDVYMWDAETQTWILQ